MLICWACDYRFDAKLIERDGLLKTRAASDGGPYRLYNCPRCFKASKVEATPQNRWFASPPRDFSLMDYLFGWFELLSPKDFLRVVRWHQKHAEARRLFFEREGDRRHSRLSVTGAIRSLVLGRPPTEEDPDYESWRRQREAERRREANAREREATTEHRRRERAERRRRQETEIPHPYRILGVSTEASEAEIRTAFNRLVREHHPDKQTSRDPAVLEQANRRLQELLDAYRELTTHS